MVTAHEVVIATKTQMKYCSQEKPNVTWLTKHYNPNYNGKVLYLYSSRIKTDLNGLNTIESAT